MDFSVQLCENHLSEFHDMVIDFNYDFFFELLKEFPIVNSLRMRNAVHNSTYLHLTQFQGVSTLYIKCSHNLSGKNKVLKRTFIIMNY